MTVLLFSNERNQSSSRVRYIVMSLLIKREEGRSFTRLVCQTNTTSLLMVQYFSSSPFSDMLKMGKSKTWTEALKKLTGSETLDVGALTEYFEPLLKWMVEQREEIG